jgi:sugar/nucleoside kinase (ribokinase family)
MSLLVVGSVAYDSIETPFDKVEDALGGSATYFSSVASFFTPVNLVAVVGEDYEHEKIRFLKKRGVNFDGLTTEPGKTFRWSGKYLKNMNDRETIYTHLNVFEKFNPVLPDSYKNSEYVFLANIGPLLQYNVIEQITKPKFVAMDTMNFWITGTPSDLKKTLAKVDALIINDSEVQLLSGEHNIFKGAKVIQNMGPKTLIIKKGEHGAILVNNDSYFMCPAFPVENLFDPTGAGDTFAGGFMGYLAAQDKITDETLRQGIVVGTATASLCVEAFSLDRLVNLKPVEINARVNKLIKLVNVAPAQNWLP